MKQFRNLQSRKGFTLIEILVVIAIIGLLASVILVGLGAFRSRGRDARRIADLRGTQNALELYYSKEQRYPDAANWAALVTALTGAGIGVSTISNDPLNPSDSTKTYSYGISSDKQNYVLAATLEDANNSALKDDADGTVHNISCADPVYCVQF